MVDEPLIRSDRTVGLMPKVMMIMGYYDDFFQVVVGKQVVEIKLTEDLFALKFDDGTHQCFSVEGDCCSHSYFHDIVGADKLLFNGPITEFTAVDLDIDKKEISGEYYKKHGYLPECISVYGYRIISEHPVFGEQTTVLSFRNESNGYYGGWMNLADDAWPEGGERITSSSYTVD